VLEQPRLAQQEISLAWLERDGLLDGGKGGLRAR